MWVNGTPMFHVGGAVLTLLGTLSRRGAYVLMPEWDAKLALELIERERGEAILIVPTIFRVSSENCSRYWRGLLESGRTELSPTA